MSDKLKRYSAILTDYQEVCIVQDALGTYVKYDDMISAYGGTPEEVEHYIESIRAGQDYANKKLFKYRMIESTAKGIVDRLGHMDKLICDERFQDMRTVMLRECWKVIKELSKQQEPNK